MRQIGIEEELLLVDGTTGERVNVSRRVLQQHRREHVGQQPEQGADDLDPELLQHVVETRTDPTDDLGEALGQLRRARHTAVAAARAAGVEVAATGTAPLTAEPTQVTPDSRYERIVDRFGSVARAAGTMGMHVHVEVDGDEEGVRVLDGIRPWLPVLVALSANSPFDAGEDTSYASWRHQVWSRWPAAGQAEPFGSVAEYRRVCDQLLASGAALDTGMLYFDARLADDYPTVEIRVADACTDARDAGLVAALARALVHTSADEQTATPVRADLLRGAHWVASRDGLGDRLVHPATGLVVPAREAVDALVGHVDAALREAGDDGWVDDELERVWSVGGGAQRQRHARRGDDLRPVIADLVERTAQEAATG